MQKPRRLKGDRPHTRLGSALLAVAAFHLALGCEGSSAPPDADLDASTGDAAPDAAHEADGPAIDVEPDARVDVPADASADAPLDATPDAPLDATPDAPLDAAPDAPLDATPDAPLDATPEAALDGPAADAPPDAPPLDVPSPDAPPLDMPSPDAPSPDAPMDRPAPVDGPTSEPADDAGTGCAPGQTRCAGTCVDTATNDAHCSACGRACSAGSSCVAGVCAGPYVRDLQMGGSTAIAVRDDGRAVCWGVGAGICDRRSGPRMSAALGPALGDISQLVHSDAQACVVRASGEVACWGALAGGFVEAPRPEPGVRDVVRLAGSGSAWCGLTRGGTMVCWGESVTGEFGPGAPRVTTVPLYLTWTPDATEIAGSDRGFCVIRAGGAVWCWGANPMGRLGVHASVAAVNTPTRVAGVDDAVMVRLGSSHGCALRRDGTVWCWGSNTFGELGNGTTTSSLTAVPVRLAAPDVVEIAVTGYATCARHRSGAVSCWGSSLVQATGVVPTGHVPLPVPVLGITDATGLRAGAEAVCVTRAAGGVYCWGSGRARGDGLEYSPFANVPVFGLDRPMPCSGAACELPVNVGLRVGCAVRPGGRVACWGYNADGVLRDRTTTSRLAPVPLDALVDAVDVGAGRSHACAVASSGGVRCWGSNASGELGGGTFAATASVVDVFGVSDAVEVRSGEYFNCARRRGGELVCWGSGYAGQLGNGTTASRSTPSPVNFGGEPHGVARVSVGAYNACAIRAGGAVWCWGGTNLGNGTTAGSPIPVPVRAAGGAPGALTGATDVAVGTYHTCVVQSGRVACWGRNDLGQLGDSTMTMQQQTPVYAVGITDAVRVAVGVPVELAAPFTCALRATGAVSCWGANNYGHLGDGTRTNRAIPGAVPGISDGVGISAGAGICVRRRGGALTCWPDAPTGATGQAPWEVYGFP